MGTDYRGTWGLTAQPQPSLPSSLRNSLSVFPSKFPHSPHSLPMYFFSTRTCRVALLVPVGMHRGTLPRLESPWTPASRFQVSPPPHPSLCGVWGSFPGWILLLFKWEN